MINQQDQSVIIAYLEAELAKHDRKMSQLREVKYEAERKAYEEFGDLYDEASDLSDDDLYWATGEEFQK